MKSGAAPSPETEATFHQAIADSPFAGIFNEILNDPSLQANLANLLIRMRGLLDDGRGGKETSALIETIKKASPQHFDLTRRQYRAIRSSALERVLDDAAAAAAPEEAAAMMALRDFLRFQRRLIRENPVMALHIFASYLHENVPLELLSIPEPTNFATVMSFLRRD